MLEGAVFGPMADEAEFVAVLEPVSGLLQIVSRCSRVGLETLSSEAIRLKLRPWARSLRNWSLVSGLCIWRDRLFE
jgi:hypothetical protein